MATSTSSIHEVDQQLVTEISICAVNEAWFYDLTKQVRRNFAIKHSKVEFDRSLAIPFLACTWIPKVLDYYERSYCTEGWSKQVTPQEREAIAGEVLDHWWEEICTIAGEIRASRKFKTIADVRRAHLGYWFKNKRKGEEGFIGNLRRSKFMVTWERDDFDGKIYYKVWGVYPTDDGADIRPITSFSSKELCLAEVANKDPQSPIEQEYARLTPRSDRYRLTQV